MKRFNSGPFCGKERFEDTGLSFFVHADPAVFNPDDDVLPGRCLYEGILQGRTIGDSRREGEGAALRHRVAGIQAEV